MRRFFLALSVALGLSACAGSNFTGTLSGQFGVADGKSTATVSGKAVYEPGEGSQTPAAIVEGSATIDEKGAVSGKITLEIPFRTGAADADLTGRAVVTVGPGASGPGLVAMKEISTHQSEMLALVHDVALAHGIDPVSFAAMAWIESRLIATAASPLSSAKGLFQFIASTADLFGLTNPFDPDANARAGAELWLENSALFVKRFGRSPEAWEVYAMHQQGPHAALRMLAAGDAPAVSVSGKSAIVNNGGNLKITAREFMGFWKDKFLKAEKLFILK